MEMSRSEGEVCKSEMYLPIFYLKGEEIFGVEAILNS
jgi:hypothetical protein